MTNPPAGAARHARMRTHETVPPAFQNARVQDAMRPGLLTCQPDTHLQAVAQIMAVNNVHCVIVADLEEHGDPPLGLITALDLACAFEAEGPACTAGNIAARPVTIDPDESLAWAAQLMRERGVHHLLVVERETHKPTGILSSMDLAAVLAWGIG